MADIFLPHYGAQIARQRFRSFSEGRLHVYFQHEMHTAAQVQAKVHG